MVSLQYDKSLSPYGNYNIAAKSCTPFCFPPDGQEVLLVLIVGPVRFFEVSDHQNINFAITI